MPTEGQQLFRSRDEIVDSLIAGLLDRVPDAYIGEDGNLVLLFNIFGEVHESVFLAIQIVADDMYVTTASPSALERHASDYQVPRLAGVRATGELLFTGAGGTEIPANTEVASILGGGLDPLYFTTDALVTIANPGTPTAPVLADGGAGFLPAGTYEYAIAFTTAMGQTLMGPPSNAVNLAINHTAALSAIPLGGPGTVYRLIYRRFNGGAWVLASAVLNNVGTTQNDDGTDATGGPPLEISTAERVYVDATAEDVGTLYNLVPGTITELTDAPDGVTDVINPAAFSGGEDEETTESFRARLLKAIRDPGTGSLSDLESWALEIPGVGSATAIQNDNLGVTTAGHVTVRITGTGGAVPSADLIAAVLLKLTMENFANITLHVTGFTAVALNVTADVTAATGYVLGDLTAGVTAAIVSYINSLGTGETFVRAAAVASIMTVPGVADVSITTPSSNYTPASSVHKVTVGVITVT